ncbi:MAG: glycosyltransferase family 2 protein [Acholeplasmatales bacterium]|nr:glycosyltransferase family 2 protein [Acholeplasmatales bacterium]
MILDIIIPQYKEKEEEVKILLDSIASQKDVDFNLIYVTIVNDKSDVLLTDEFISKYSLLHTKFLINDKNTGPGLARQKGIDNTLGDYIMFVDSDDYLENDYVLKTIFDVCEKRHPLYIVSNIVTKTLRDDKLVNVVRKGLDTMPWMHGKVYLRKHLEDNNIRFHDVIRELEDSYFTNCVIGTMNPKDICYLNYNTIFWTVNPISITRKPRKYPYLVDIFDEYFITPEYIYEFLCRHKSQMRFTFYVTSVIGRYILLNCNLFDFIELNEKRNNYKAKLDELIKKRKNLFRLFTVEQLKTIYKNEERALALRNNIEKIYVDFDLFYTKVIE